MSTKKLSLVISGDIESETFEMIVEQIKKNEPQSVELIINSYGGDLNIAFGIYDYLKSLKIKITTKGYGQVSSAAILLFLLGEKRYLSENAVVFLHEPYTLNSKMSKDEKIELKRVSDNYFNIISNITKIDKKILIKLAKKGTYLTKDFLIKNKFTNE